MIHGSIVKLILQSIVEVVLVRADGFQQLSNVVGVQCAGLCGHSAWQVCIADVSHTLKYTFQKSV